MRIVLDTNVVFEGLTTQGGASGLIIDLWRVNLMEVYVSTSLALEYAEVCSRQLSPARWHRLQPVLGALLDQSHYVPIYYSWRPMSPDPGDDHLIDCAMNANATIITWNVRDFARAQQSLGLRVQTPTDYLAQYAKTLEESEGTEK